MPLPACRGTKAKLAINADCIKMLSALPNDRTVSDARNARVARFGTAVFCVTYGTCVTKRRNESDFKDPFAVTAVAEETHTVFFKSVSPFVHLLLECLGRYLFSRERTIPFSKLRIASGEGSDTLNKRNQLVHLAWKKQPRIVKTIRDKLPRVLVF